MELKADNDFISQCQDYLETWGNTLAMYGALGSGKRTLAAQVALRLAKKDSKLKIKIVRVMTYLMIWNQCDQQFLSCTTQSRHGSHLNIPGK